jgi:hypothetical protein
MDRWKAEVGRAREEKRRERGRKKKMPLLEIHRGVSVTVVQVAELFEIHTAILQT